jgi:hypothetical protein
MPSGAVLREEETMPSWLSVFAEPRLIIIVAGLIIVLAVEIWWWFPKWQAHRLRLKIRDVKARTDIEDNFRKLIGQQILKGFELLGSDKIMERVGGIYGPTW